MLAQLASKMKGPNSINNRKVIAQKHANGRQQDHPCIVYTCQHTPDYSTSKHCLAGNY